MLSGGTVSPSVVIWSNHVKRPLPWTPARRFAGASVSLAELSPPFSRQRGGPPPEERCGAQACHRRRRPHEDSPEPFCPWSPRTSPGTVPSAEHGPSVAHGGCPVINIVYVNPREHPVPTATPHPPERRPRRALGGSTDRGPRPTGQYVRAVARSTTPSRPATNRPGSTVPHRTGKVHWWIRPPVAGSPSPRVRFLRKHVPACEPLRSGPATGQEELRGKHRFEHGRNRPRTRRTLPPRPHTPVVCRDHTLCVVGPTSPTPAPPFRPNSGNPLR